MAGVVEAVGKGVTRFRPGDPVFGETVATNLWLNGGAFAEFVSVPQDLLALKPDKITFEQAASIPTSGYIALMNLRGGRLIPAGSRVLINGAGGGVGSIALQIAKARGAHVTGADSAGKLGMLRLLGADRAIDYAQEDFTRADVRYDLIFDVPGNHSLSECMRALTADGKYVLVGHEKYGPSGNSLFGSPPPVQPSSTPKALITPFFALGDDLAPGGGGAFTFDLTRQLGLEAEASLGTDAARSSLSLLYRFPQWGRWTIYAAGGGGVQRDEDPDAAA
jgi:D-arabinose 1-dehydrogenase-like Zn-dependent alcohol dehydrogenase